MNMVLAERNSEIMRNGRRSRGPSPNGHGGTPDSSSDEDNSIKKNGSKSKTKQSEYEEKIRVGRDYQATCPELIPAHERKPELLNDRALLVWSPTKDIPDNKLEEYISVAKEKYGYNGEQALGMLFWHKHDLERAVMDLANFTPFPDEWTVEDKVLFEQAFQFHGKSFHRIRQMLPDKSIASLVKYYYSWKKTRHRQSVMDRQEKAKLKDGGSENGSDNGSNDESDSEEKDQLLAPSTSQDPLQQKQQQFGSGNTDTSSSSSKNSKTNQIQLSSSSSVTSSTMNIKRQQQQANNTIAAAGGQSQSIGSANNMNMSSGAGTSANTSSMNSNAGAAGLTAAATSQSNTITAGSGGNGVNSATTASSSSIPSTSSSSTNAGCCTGCGVSCNQVNNTPHGNLCNSCYHHWRRTGTKRPTTGPYFGKRFRDRNAERHKRKPPRGMHINHDDIVALASSNNNQDELLANTEREIISLLSQVQQNKQHISSLKRKISESSDDLRPQEQNNRVNSRWNNEEVTLAVHGIKKFGKNFQAIAETIGTKTEAHIRTFFVNYRRRYNLDAVLKEHEAEKEAQQRQQVSTTTPGNNSAEIAQLQQQQQSQQQQQQQQQHNKNSNNEVEIIDISSTTPTSTTPITNTSQPQQQQQLQSQQNQQQQQSQQLQQQQQFKPAPQQENIIMEVIDLESEPNLEPSPPKKPAISILNETVKTSI